MNLLLLISLSIAVMLIWRGIRAKQQNETTEWEFWKDAPPLITVLPNGEKRFQHQEYWSRFDRITMTWERKTVTAPQLLRFEEATNPNDAYNLSSY